MKVLLVSKACLVGAYQRKLEEIAAQPDIELSVVVPLRWRDERGTVSLERAHTKGYTLHVDPIVLNGSYHLHFFPSLASRIREFQPDVLHIDEEPYNFATWHAIRLASKFDARALFFSWQNIERRYPWPFRQMERSVLQRADFAICGNTAAGDVLRRKGYTGALAVIPQFGVDPHQFQQRALPEGPASGFVVGYMGRLVPEKGVDLLLDAVAALDTTVRLKIIGSGPQLRPLRRQATQLGIAARVEFTPWVASAQIPSHLAQFDVLVLPSRTQPNWKEQFGRTLVEAMAAGVPVIGSTCGEIPSVIHTAGIVFQEGDGTALADALRTLRSDPALRIEYARRGRERVLARYTQQQIASQTVAAYRAMVGRATPV